MKISTKMALLTLQMFIFCAVNAQSNFWTDVAETTLQSRSTKRAIVPEKGRTVSLAYNEIKQFFATVPKEFTIEASRSKSIISMPKPDGGFQNFSIVETAIMEPGLAQKVPGIRTYGGQGIEDPTATITIDITPLGFHAMILSPVNGAVYIDPYSRNSTSAYIVYYREDFKSTKKLIEKEGHSLQNKQRAGLQNRVEAGPCIGNILKRYRLAVACTGEYAQAVGATTKEDALGAIVTTVNRVNGIYERELALRLVLVADNLKIVFITPATDKFTGNDDANILIDESQKVIDDSIKNANYDIGHTFSTGGGGLAALGSVCLTGQKASGITGSESPVNDPFDIDFVAHEFGHQFGATHTFNAATGNCLGNGASNTNVEPGSGSTIMSYAGICGINDLQLNSDPFFHPLSLKQITDYVTTGAGKTCAVQTATGNSAPVVNAGSDYTIPRSTPFILTGSATDPNNDVLTYAWDQMDFGGPFGNAASPTGQAPLFRAFVTSLSPSRIFPKLSNIINNNSTIGEVLAGYGRTINMRLTARDNKAGGGGVCSDDMRLTVIANAGPFVVTFPNAFVNVQAGTFRAVTWNVAGTNLPPVSTANVNIHMSTDGGNTFPIALALNTPNDGSEEVKIPANLTTQARVRVMGAGNVYFDMSNTNFSIQNATTTEFVFNNPDVVTDCAGANPQSILKTSGLNGYNTPITLSSSGNPAGSTVSFSSNPVTPGSDVIVTLQGNFAPGKYIITVTGTSGSITKSQNLEFVVGPLSTQATLNSPTNNSIGQPFTPSFNWSAVSGASSYTLEISDNAAFSTLTQSIGNIAGTGFTLSTPLVEGREYYWRVRAQNSCGSGTPSAAFRFKTVTPVCASPVVSADVPKAIPAAGTPSVTSTITIADNVLISDINVVGLKGTHDYIGDIGMKLTSPSNTTVILFDQVCETGPAFDLNLDDQSSVSTFPCPPINGVVVKPTEALSAFNGQTSAGQWTLTIKDYFDTDGGSLTGWGLRICSNVATPLPVNWLSFTAQKAANNSVAINWSTANEVRNQLYEIEKSADGTNFVSIGSTPAGNNMNMLQQYYFIDRKPYGGDNYYRLKQIDVDGQYTYSAIVKVTLESSRLLWTVYPNPARDHSIIRMMANAKQIEVSLADVSGKIVYRRSQASARAGEQITLPLKNMAKGMYILLIKTATESKSEKIVVQ